MLNDPEGHPVASKALLAEGPLVVPFYRGVWCPYCNLELQALQAALPEITARGAGLIAISPRPSACASLCRTTWSNCRRAPKTTCLRSTTIWLGY